MARIIDLPLTAGDGSCDPRAVHGTWGALDAAQRRGLAYTPEVAAETAPLYERVKHVIPAVEWPAYAPLISAINKMKRAKKEKVIRTAMNGCLKERGYGIIGWEKVKKKRAIATTVAAN